MTTAHAYLTAHEPALNGAGFRFTAGTQRHDPDYRLVDAQGREVGLGIQDCTAYRGVFVVYGFLGGRVHEIAEARALDDAKAFAMATFERRFAVLQ